MNFFNYIPWNRIFKKEHPGHSEYSHIEKESISKKLIIGEDETLSNGTAFFRELIKDNLNDLVVVCVGTDKCIFDSLAPFVGSILECRGFRFPVYGTIESPIHAINLENSLIKIKNNHPYGFFIGIDACCSNEECEFEIHLRDYPIHPGASTNKKLPSVGNVSIVGIMSVNNINDMLNKIRLRDVICMANKIADIIMGAVESYEPNDLHKDNVLDFMNYRNK